jgi:hypothetical protein
MKMRKVAVMLGAMSLFAAATQTGATPWLPDTGLGAQGTLDPNYTLTDGSGQLPLIQYPTGAYGDLIPNDWPSLPGPAQWISPWINGTSTDPWITDNQGYTYVFQTVVGGTGSGMVSGLWDSDDNATMFVNGVPVASRPSWPGGIASFSVPLTAGDIVTFDVYNLPLGSGSYGNPAGLIVSTPDGGMTAGLLGGALLGLQAIRRKLSR